jgi:dUTP pyrophosphatase
MTIISEQQAYLMGWVHEIKSHGIEGCKGRLMSPPILTCIISDLNTVGVFGYANYSSLESVRRKDFIRGFFDRNGVINNLVDVRMPVSLLTDEMMSVIDSVQSTDGVWIGVNALEFMATLYYPGVTNYVVGNYHAFVRWAEPDASKQSELPTFKWKKTREDAVAPTKNRFSDSGYDLTVLSKIKESNGVIYYDTGISVEPSNGYYFEIVGRSSISKTGWMVANNIGIIDASYRGSIIVALVRANQTACEIETPMRLVQMIPRKLILMNSLEELSLSDTKRGSGGFGSSG